MEFTPNSKQSRKPARRVAPVQLASFQTECDDVQQKRMVRLDRCHIRIPAVLRLHGRSPIIRNLYVPNGTETLMNTRALSAILSPALLAISLGISADENPKETAKPADEAQMRKHCEEMKNMDMSKMSAAEHRLHEKMMKRCKEMMDKDKSNENPKDSRSY